MESAMFPLGGVLLPGGLLPLHVFEERYRTMVRRCLDDGSGFGVVLIERGSEVGGGEVRTDVGTSADIVESTELPDGRFALLVAGRERLVVERWLPDDPHPRAEVSPWPDEVPGHGLGADLGGAVPLLRKALAMRAELGYPSAPVTTELSADPVEASYQAVELSFVGAADRQRLLACPTVEARAAGLVDLLDDQIYLLGRHLEQG